MILVVPPAPPALVAAAYALPRHHHRHPTDHRGPRVPRRPRRGQAWPRPWYLPELEAPRAAFGDGELALGVSVAKARRWLVLGGHGRNGPG